MQYLRLLLLPFSLLYGLVVIIRNWFYDSGFFKSYQFKVPVISVGNLAVGGAGKTPMTEYLIRLLMDNYKIATLSRGYGRKTKGFIIAQTPIPHSQSTTHNSQLTTHHSPLTIHYSSLTTRIGDEPAQFKEKFPAITVAVCEDRVKGIEELAPAHNIILLDDAYQHRAVEPGYSILLFDYQQLLKPQFLLPAGDLRETKSGKWRAQALIVTKCPPATGQREAVVILEKLKPLPYQQLFFTALRYQPLIAINGSPASPVINPQTTVFLLTGIANTVPLLEYIAAYTTHIIHHKYPDHHPFTPKNISKLAADFDADRSTQKIIITTEKDAQRLGAFMQNPPLKGLPVFILPIEVYFLNGDRERFNRLITDYVSKHTAHHSLD